MEANPGLLPADVLLKIFSYCSYRDLVQFQFVCRWWQQVSRDKHLWRDIVYKPGKRKKIKDIIYFKNMIPVYKTCKMEKTKDIIENLKKSPELRALDLRDIECTDVTKELVVEVVNACPQLEQLSVCWYCLYKKFHFKMEKIKILILHDNNDDYVGLLDYFEHLHNCFPNVEHLDCSNIAFEVGNFRAYLTKGGQSLHTLGLNCRMFGVNECILLKECILLDLSMCTNLKSLILSHTCNIGDLLVVESLDHLRQISSLRLQIAGCYYDYNLLSMLRYFPTLVVLEFDKRVYDSEQQLLIIAKECPLLEKLTLSNNFSNQSLKYVSNFKKLTSLCLRSNHNIRNACMAQLQDILELKYLDISHCYNLTPQCLLDLCSFAKLQTLKFDLLDKYFLTDVDVSQVKNPDLHIMFYNVKDTRGLDYLRHQRLRISLLKGFMMCDSELFCQYCYLDEDEIFREWYNEERCLLLQDSYL